MSNNVLPGKIKRFSESGNSRTEKMLTSPCFTSAEAESHRG